jgi:hypothetical protein
MSMLLLSRSRLLKTTPNVVVGRVPSSHTLTAYAPVFPLPAALLEAVLSSLGGSERELAAIPRTLQLAEKLPLVA